MRFMQSVGRKCILQKIGVKSPVILITFSNQTYNVSGGMFDSFKILALGPVFLRKNIPSVQSGRKVPFG